MGVSGQLQAPSVVPAPQEGTPQWSLNRRLGGPYTWSGYFFRRLKIYYPCQAGIKPWTVQPVWWSTY